MSQRIAMISDHASPLAAVGGIDSGGQNIYVAETARYLAAHSPTVRAEGQTYQIAERLHRGENLFEE